MAVSRKSTRKNGKGSRKDRKKSRKATRKVSKASRKSRNLSKKSRKGRKNSRKAQRGGNPMELSLAQGREYNEIHANQRGGAMLMGAPLSQISDSMLPGDLRASAGVAALDQNLAEIRGMQDAGPVAAPPHQAGGGRKGRKARKSSKKSKKNSKKSKKNSKKSKKASRKGSRKSRNGRKAQRGGALSWAGAPYNGPSMLLTPAQAAKAGTADFSNPLLRA
jgi:hypothetical protein